MQTEETPHDAFCRLYAETWPDVLRYLGRRCGTDAAEDLANEVYLITWRRWSVVPRRRELPWLYGVARNLLLERSRTQGRDGIALSEHSTGLPAYRDIAEGVVSAHSVRHVLAELKPNDREPAAVGLGKSRATRSRRSPGLHGGNGRCSAAPRTAAVLSPVLR
jgi:RNA polymerase sigma-70 factor (ECF subfamily)